MDDTTRERLRGYQTTIAHHVRDAGRTRVERDRYLRELYDAHVLNVSQAARDMNVSRRTIHDIIRRPRVQTGGEEGPTPG